MTLKHIINEGQRNLGRLDEREVQTRIGTLIEKIDAKIEARPRVPGVKDMAIRFEIVGCEVFNQDDLHNSHSAPIVRSCAWINHRHFDEIIAAPGAAPFWDAQAKF